MTNAFYISVKRVPPAALLAMHHMRHTNDHGQRNASQVAGQQKSATPPESKQIVSPLVSVIVPVHNAACWLDECFTSISQQSYRPLEVSVVDDLSTDDSWLIIEQWINKFEKADVTCVCSQNDGKSGRGCGFARNRSVLQSSGSYLCFQDADDVMEVDRVSLQLREALSAEEDVEACIIGASFQRIPAAATPRYTVWHNSLKPCDLLYQRFREVTLAMPTWFMSRSTFDRVKGFDEGFPSVPEDLIFFYAHLRRGGGLRRVPETLVRYRYHTANASHLIDRRVLLKIRLDEFVCTVLERISHLTLWGVGRDGKKVFKLLDQKHRNKVQAFCDVAPEKVGSFYVDLGSNRKIPIVHIGDAQPPALICVALDRTGGALEENIRSKNWTEGEDYWHII